jgi:hypothetical protein
VSKAPAKATAPVKAQVKAQAAPPLTQTLGGDQFLSSGPGDCELSVDPEGFERGGVEVEPEDFGKGGVGVEVESEYDLELRIGGKVGRPGMGHLSLLTVPNKTVRW